MSKKARLKKIHKQALQRKLDHPSGPDSVKTIARRMRKNLK